MSIIQDGKNVYHAGSQLDPMLRAFFSDTCDRPSCYECPFKKRYRVSDFTIWDCFSVYDFDKEKLSRILKDNSRMLIDREAALVIKTITNGRIKSIFGRECNNI